MYFPLHKLTPTDCSYTACVYVSRPVLVWFQGTYDYRINFVGERIYFPVGELAESAFDFLGEMFFCWTLLHLFKVFINIF